MTETPITDTNAIISIIDDAIADSLGPDWNSFQAAHHVMQWLTDAGLQIVPAPKRCEYCDGTGDVHRADGEWMGECPDCEGKM